jgi:VanZ family protein
MRRLSLWLPVIAWMALLFFLSSQSRLPTLPGPITDKWEHFVAYAVLGALTLRALAHAEWRRVTLAAVAVAIAMSSAYGISDEVHQRFVPGRDYEVLDMIADAIGSAVATSLLWAWGIIGRRSDTRHVL